jgi:hypothetical protein
VKRLSHRHLLAALAVVLIALAVLQPAPAGAQSRADRVYLPFVSSGGSSGILLGMYPSGWLGNQSVIDEQLHGLSEWSGKQLSLVGTFINIEEKNYEAAIRMQLVPVYDQGYTPFINLMTTKSMAAIASGQMDSAIRQWAEEYNRFVDGGKRFAYIAPFPEMNGDWTSYGEDPVNFKKAFQRLQDIFTSVGVPQDAVRWVFAPNGASKPEHRFEYYYPSGSRVDAVGFSVYNYGYCSYPGLRGGWAPLWSLSGEYIVRMQAMAPDKPIFYTQMATSSQTANGTDAEAKNKWFREGFAWLTTKPAVRAILYFNIEDDICDMAMYRTWKTSLPDRYPGYRDAVQGAGFIYMSPEQLRKTSLRP